MREREFPCRVESGMPRCNLLSKDEPSWILFYSKENGKRVRPGMQELLPVDGTCKCKSARGRLIFVRKVKKKSRKGCSTG